MARKKTQAAPSADAIEPQDTQAQPDADAQDAPEAAAESAPEAATQDGDVLVISEKVIIPAPIDFIAVRMSLSDDSPMVRPAARFVAPYGGRYAIDGAIYELRAGSVVSADTHNMGAILAASIQLQPHA